MLQTRLTTSSYINLPSALYQPIGAEAIINPNILWFNEPLNQALGCPFDTKDSATLDLLSGQNIPNDLTPLALGYAGHQFGHYVPELGDGRAVMLGEVQTPEGTWDIQLKGSGKTRFSRQGDGLMPLGASIRETIISEAMTHLNIPTTRTMCVISHDKLISRQFGLEPAGLIARVTPSHLRFGSFQYAATIGTSTLSELVQYVLQRHFAHIQSHHMPMISFLKEIMALQAKLVASWMSVGFVHGVMNTDNMSIIGETIDYGPCAFLDDFSWQQVFSAIDIHGRYAYGNQPDIAYWNIQQLAKVLALLMSPDELALLDETIEKYPGLFQTHWSNQLLQKFGLECINPVPMQLMIDFFNCLSEASADLTHSFYYLSESLVCQSAKKTLMCMMNNTEKFTVWYKNWLAIVKSQSSDIRNIKSLMDKKNPVYIPRNHLVELSIKDAIENQNLKTFFDLMKRLRQPFERTRIEPYYFNAPQNHEKNTTTYCGT